MDQILVVSSVLLWVVVLFNLLMTLAVVRRLNAGSQKEVRKVGLEEGQLAPAFTAETLSGETVTLSTYARRTVAFIFISPHCQPCIAQLPRIDVAALNAAEIGVEVVLVSDAGVVETRALAAEHNIKAPILVAPRKSNPFLNDYKATSVPSYCVVDVRGEVQSAGHFSMEGNELKKLVESQESNEMSATRSVLSE